MIEQVFYGGIIMKEIIVINFKIIMCKIGEIFWGSIANICEKICMCIKRY